jgi:RAB6A-GEF complex partner protein 1
VDQEVRYDMQILADRLEFCWIHLRGIGALENSLWGYDGTGMRVWLNALSIETTSTPSLDSDGVVSRDVRANAEIPLDFYPLCECFLFVFSTKSMDMGHSSCADG